MKWLNTLKQFVGNSQQIVPVCLTLFDFFKGQGSWKGLRLDSPYSPWDWGEIGVKMETKYVIYQKLANLI